MPVYLSFLQDNTVQILIAGLVADAKAIGPGQADSHLLRVLLVSAAFGLAGLIVFISALIVKV